MRSTLIPEVKVDIKGGSDYSAKFVDFESNSFGENRETKMIVAQKFHMKIRGSTTQTRLQSQSDRILRETEKKTSKSCKEEEGSIGSRGGVVYRSMKTATNIFLETKTNVKIQTVHQI
jgi:hypothetical protein